MATHRTATCSLRAGAGAGSRTTTTGRARPKGSRTRDEYRVIAWLRRAIACRLGFHGAVIPTVWYEVGDPSTWETWEEHYGQCQRCGRAIRWTVPTV